MTANARAPGGASAIERYFQIRERGSTVRTELRGGVTTFVVMAYILFVNPAILSLATAGKGPPLAATLTMTALTAGVMTIAMGLYANYPFGLAAGLGLNAFVAYTLILGLGVSWPAAMGAVFIEGLIITVLVLTGFREAVLNAIPLALKRAIGIGIGAFILFIGLVNAGLVRVPVESVRVVDGVATGQPSPPVTLGTLTGWPVLIAVFGLFLTTLLLARRVRGAFLIGIIAATALGLLLHAVAGADVSTAPGVQGMLPRELAAISFETFGRGINIDIFRELTVIAALVAIFSLMLSDFFDTMGTVVGLASQARMLGPAGQVPGVERVLVVDGLAAAAGGAASASSVTTYIESSAGIAEGARTGLAAVVTGALFLAAMLLAPFAALITAEATAAALILVGVLMARELPLIDFSRLEEGLPALLTVLVMPFTYSITNGIGAGFLMYTFLQVVRGKGGDVRPMMYVVSAAFLVYFLIPVAQRLMGW